ncbi:MAG: hypothetical protein ACI4QW_03525 [Clostridia bacterium]
MVNYNQQDAILSNIAKIFEKRYKGTAEVTLVIDEGLGEFCSEIKDGTISAGSHSTLLDAAGRFLRNPSVRGSFCSAKEVCGMYFATHNRNYYEVGPLEELYEYINDLALWGMNTLKVWFDMYYFHNMEEGEAHADHLKAIIRYAKSIGVKTALGILSNEAFRNSPEHLRADWTCGHDGYIYDLNDHYHVELCPSKEGGMEQIIEYRRQMLAVFAEAQPDYIAIGAYDEGGCTCSGCAPWGSNGNIRCLEALIPVIREYIPDAEIVISLWQFGTFTGNDVEFEGMKKALEEGRLSACKYLVSEPQYARYPFEKGMPRPLIGFPEISMFGANPWGGYGANPLPKLLDGLWQENGSKLAGGWPYSEGLYEDLNKIIMLRYYRDNQPAEETVKEYLRYEFGLSGELLEKAFSAVMAMEDTLERKFSWETHLVEIARPEAVFEIEKKITEVHNALPEDVRLCKKWRLLYLRAKIDAEFVRNHGERNDAIIGYFNELISFSYLKDSTKWVKPDIQV